MAKTVTLASLITACRDRFEIDDNPVPDATLTTWINGSYFKLYNLLSNADPTWYLTSSDINVVSGTATVDLPADFWRNRRVDLLDGSTWVSIRRFEFAEENARNAVSVQDRAQTRYLIAGSTIRLNPTPNWSQTNGLRVWYIPAPTDLASGGSPVSMDGVAGWEEHVILDVGIKFFVKNEWDPSAMMAQQSAIEKQIKDLAANRDAGNPPTIRNAYREQYIDIYGKFYVP